MRTPARSRFGGVFQLKSRRSDQAATRILAIRHHRQPSLSHTGEMVGATDRLSMSPEGQANPNRCRPQ